MIVTDTATAATSFSNSVGVVTHFQYLDTPYGTRYDEVARRLVALGVRHVREGVVSGQTLLCDRERALATHGIRFSYVTQPNLTAKDLEAWSTCVGPAIEGFEGPNEYDIGHPATDTAWAQTLRTFQQSLYEAVKTSPTLRHLSVIGPSLTSGGAFQQVGDLSAFVDDGNIHDYFGTREPGTSGWGDNGYGSIAYNLAVARPAYGSKPTIATESGYGTERANGNVTEAVQAAYLPRLLLDHFEAGIVRTDLYELLDEGNAPYGFYGLLRGDLTPKPAYGALRSLLALFHDPSSQERHDALTYSLDGQTDSLHHALFEKGDGTFDLALWIERPSLDPDTRAPYPLPTRSVTVTVSRPATLTPFAFSNVFSLIAGKVVSSRATIALTDRVAILRIVPERR